MTCKTHPRYKGLRKPLLPCEACWAIYFGISETCMNCGCSEQNYNTTIKIHNDDSEERTD